MGCSIDPNIFKTVFLYFDSSVYRKLLFYNRVGEILNIDLLFTFVPKIKSFAVSEKLCNISIQPIILSFFSVVEYSCLGDWFVGKNHYFAVANTKESRKDEKYRCFLKNRDDDLYIGVSITAECNTLETVEKSPERLHITPGKLQVRLI